MASCGMAARQQKGEEKWKRRIFSHKSDYIVNKARPDLALQEHSTRKVTNKINAELSCRFVDALQRSSVMVRRDEKLRDQFLFIHASDRSIFPSRAFDVSIEGEQVERAV